MEENKLLLHTEFSNTIDIGKIIAIYSSQSVNEPFFLYKVFEKTQMSSFLMIMIIILMQALTPWSIYLEKTFKKF